MLPLILAITLSLLPLTSGHAALFHPSMWGFNVTAQTFSYDNRPVAPLINYTFEEWWFHGHLDYPPNDGDFFELPAGQAATAEIACDKGATSYWESDPGGDIQDGDNVCPGSPISEFHTTGYDDLKGCGLAITYKSNVSDVVPDDFTMFSINQTCVWTRFTEFQVPERMPPCPEDGCICAFFWIHSPDSGSEQNYMNGFRCNVTNSTSDVSLATPQLARRCGADPDNGKEDASPGNCTYGAKLPFYWFQAEDNNMFEGTYSPPFYNDLYNFLDGAQNDIFEDSYPNGLPTPSANSTVIPTPDLYGVEVTSTPNLPSYLSAVATPYTVTTSATSSPTMTASATSSTSSSSVNITTTTITSTVVVTVEATATVVVAAANATASTTTTMVSSSAVSNATVAAADIVLAAVPSASTTSSSDSDNGMCRSTLTRRRLSRRSTSEPASASDSTRTDTVLNAIPGVRMYKRRAVDRKSLWQIF